jgi:hypothetical protein
MIGVQMGQRQQVEVFNPGAGLAETHEYTAADIDQDTRPALVPDQITGCGTLVICNRPARAQYLQRYTVVRTGAGRIPLTCNAG